jgi:hypothetical protein
MAYIEHQILSDAAQSGSLSASVNRVEAGYGIAAGSLGLGVFPNVRMICLLYSLIVVPREIWLSHDALLQDKVNDLFSVDQFTFLLLPDGRKPTAYGFVRHIRNAVSHANFEFLPSGDLEFWDRPKPNAPENFRVTLAISEVEHFLSIVGAFLANLRTANRQPHKIQ